MEEVAKHEEVVIIPATAQMLSDILSQDIEVQIPTIASDLQKVPKIKSDKFWYKLFNLLIWAHRVFR